MAIKTFKPYTPARRNMTVSGFDGVDKKAKPERSLVETLKKHAGRNSYGHITVRHRGGGNKRKYRIIDFKRQKFDMFATVERLEYDPNRSAYIALVKYEVQGNGDEQCQHGGDRHSQHTQQHGVFQALQELLVLNNLHKIADAELECHTAGGLQTGVVLQQSHADSIENRPYGKDQQQNDRR